MPDSAIDYGTHTAAPAAIDYGSHAAAMPVQPAPQGFWSSLGAAVNPLPALREWLNRSSNVGAAADAYHELTKLDAKAAADPANKGLPRNKWTMPEPTDAQRAIIEKGIRAPLPGADDNSIPFAGPGITAAGQASQGNLAGAAGTLVGGYGVPAALAAIPGSQAAADAGAFARTANGQLAAGAAKIATGPAVGWIAHELGVPAEVAASAATALGLPTVKAGLADITESIKAKVAAVKAGREPLPTPSNRPAPAWQANPAPQPAPTPDATPIPGQLPSGRVPGGIANATPLPPPAAANPYAPSGPQLGDSPLVTPAMRAASAPGALARPAPVVSPEAAPPVTAAPPATAAPEPAPAPPVAAVAAKAAPANPAAAAYAAHIADVTSHMGSDIADATAAKDAKFADYVSDPANGPFRQKPTLTGDDVANMSLQDYRDLHSDVPTGKTSKTGKPTKFSPGSDDAKLETRKQGLANLLRSREAAAADQAARPAAYANAAEEFAAAKARMAGVSGPAAASQ